MPRRKTTVPVAQEARQDVRPHVIDPRAVYDLPTVRAALGLKLSTIRTAWRRQGLKVSRRAGKVYILGAWLLEWLEAGIDLPKARQQAKTP